jgi:hypothetical protein
MWPLIAALLFAAPQATTDVAVQVVFDGGADDPRLARALTAAIAQVGLGGTAVDLSAFFEAQPEGCRANLECICHAPPLRGMRRVLMVHSTALERQLRAADLRLFDCSAPLQTARLSEVVDAGELSAWFKKAARRLVLHAD